MESVILKDRSMPGGWRQLGSVLLKILPDKDAFIVERMRHAGAVNGERRPWVSWVAAIPMVAV
jgi:hypothetical protein